MANVIGKLRIARKRMLPASRRLRGRRGSVALIFSVAATTLVVCSGFAVDASRLWLLRARLQAGVDAAALQAVAANEDPSNTGKSTTDASNLFWANFGRTSSAAGNATGCPGSTINKGFMGATVCGSDLSVTYPDTSHAVVQATASLPMTLMKLAGYSTLSASASANAQRAGGAEVALVLDISLSMSFGMGDGTGNAKIQALQIAAGNMLTALYGTGTTVPNLWVSVVPFAGAVNVGKSHTGWLDSTFTSGTFRGAVDNGNGAGWRGCVEARQNGRDLTEGGPGTAPFAPFFWPSTYQQYPKPGGFYRGDNDWTNGTINDTSTADQTQTGDPTPFLQGPNLGCPHNAVLPLTASKTTVANAINAFTLTGPVGTVVPQGLQWGWFTLSPSWQGSGGWNLTTSYGAALPLPYASPNNKKVIVLMTDGTTDVSGTQTFYGPANNFSSMGGSCIHATIAPSCIPRNSGGTTTPKSAAWANSDADTWYSPYGRASAGRISSVRPTYTNNAAADSETAVRDFSAALDTNTANLCTAIKAQGIIIYTIFFHGPQDDAYDWYLGARSGTPGARTILQNCATDVNHFYDANNTASINSAFVTIAQQISALRLQQ